MSLCFLVDNPQGHWCAFSFYYRARTPDSSTINLSITDDHQIKRFIWDLCSSTGDLQQAWIATKWSLVLDRPVQVWLEILLSFLNWCLEVDLISENLNKQAFFFSSVKGQENRSKSSCHEPIRSSSTSTGVSNDARKKTSEFTRCKFTYRYILFSNSVQLCVFYVLQELLQWWQNHWKLLRSSWDGDEHEISSLRCEHPQNKLHRWKPPYSIMSGFLLAYLHTYC